MSWKQKKRVPLARAVLGAGLALAAASRAEATDLTFHVGPPSVGQGGSNPISIPPVDFREWEFTYVTDKDNEWNLGATPGLLFGSRSTTGNGVYVSFGGGLVISANGVGPGVYSAFGYNSSGTYQFNAELKQAIGYDFGENTVVSPYALRIGLTIAL